MKLKCSAWEKRQVNKKEQGSQKSQEKGDGDKKKNHLVIGFLFHFGTPPDNFFLLSFLHKNVFAVTAAVAVAELVVVIAFYQI